MKKWIVLAMSLLLCFALIACDSQPPSVPRTEKDTTEASEDDKKTTSSKSETPAETTDVPTQNGLEWLNVATYNILHCMDYATYAKDGSADINPDSYVDFMQTFQIDLLGLNEVDVNCDRSKGWVKSEYYTDYKSDQPAYIAAKISERTGVQYYSAFAPALDGCLDAAHKDYNDGKSMYGNAIISRFPILSTRMIQVAVHEIDPNDPKTQIGDPLGSGNYYEQKGALIAEIDMNGTKVTVISAHFGLVKEEQDLIMDALENEIKHIKTPLILMGDFNSYPSSTNISRFNLLLKPTSLEETPGTFISGRRIDYIFTSDDMVTKDLKVPLLTYSDHYPVIVKMALKPTVE